MDEIQEPDCISGDKKHTVWKKNGCNSVYECENCFERFYLISETAAKKANLFIEPK